VHRWLPESVAHESDARARAEGEPGFADGTPLPDWGRAAELVAQKAEAALAAGISPSSSQAEPTVRELARAFASLTDDPDSPAWRGALADRLAQGSDRRAERYWQLLAIMNGWPPIPTTVPAWEWLIAALRR
jgi:hypothetical protein